MDMAPTRRARLQQAIDTMSGGNAAEFARKAKKPSQVINDLLKGRKSFGEKIARSIESAAKLGVGYLDMDGTLDGVLGGKLEPDAALVELQQIVAALVQAMAQHRPVEAGDVGEALAPLLEKAKAGSLMAALAPRLAKAKGWRAAR